ncbi:MAG: hypothetical protein JWP93_1226 [Polaromonas sp.]|jgi:DNA repair exonuclease SbcCD ATPase subunit|nr:hypothetical protein [Polaromonas sp.]
MESKSFSRGIQQEDVWAAADSLIADGQRPTIERVRQKIGRGSPNTVSPMLEDWFATLGTRIGVNKGSDGLGDIPNVLKQALKDAWVIALTKGREESALEIAQAQADLAQATRALNERATDLDQTEQIGRIKRQSLEDALDAAIKNHDDALARLREAQELASKREKEIESLQDKLAAVETERASERRSHQDAVADYVRERKKSEERAQSTQQKLLEEIDRARQETKKMTGEAQKSEKQFLADKNLWQMKVRLQEEELAKIQALYTASTSDLNALRQTHAASDSRAQEVQSLLKGQLADSKTTIARLTEALLTRAERPVARTRFPPRKLKGASGNGKR